MLVLRLEPFLGLPRSSSHTPPSLLLSVQQRLTTPPPPRLRRPRLPHPPRPWSARQPLRHERRVDAAGGSQRPPIRTSASFSSSSEMGSSAMARVREFLKADPLGGWDQAWAESTTPWDLGSVTPSVSLLIQSGALPPDAKTVLVPGCGSGYDVVALAERGKRRVTGLDISETAVQQARELAAKDPEASAGAEFVIADFFTFTPAAPYDIIFDYTFFCALDPSLRPEWAKKTASLLAPSGSLYTLMFPVDEREGGPPFAVSKKAYEAVLSPLGFVPQELPTVSHPAREGKELLVCWTRSKEHPKM